MIIATALSLPFMKRSPIDLPPILSVELIQITDNTSIPFAAEATETLKKKKKKERSKKISVTTSTTCRKKKKRNLIEFLCQRT